MQHDSQHSKVHFNCAQQILIPYCERFGLSRDIAIKIGSAFGGGINCLGETCGAITGALMVIGLKYGGIKEDEKSQKNWDNLINQFFMEFKSRNGSIRCKELLGFDLSIPEEKIIVDEKKIAENRCPKFINDSITLLNHLLNHA